MMLVHCRNELIYRRSHLLYCFSNCFFFFHFFQLFIIWFQPFFSSVFARSLRTINSSLFCQAIVLIEFSLGFCLTNNLINMVQSNYKRDDYLSFEVYLGLWFLWVFFFLSSVVVSCCFQKILFCCSAFNKLFALRTSAVLSFVTIVTGVAVAFFFMSMNCYSCFIHTACFFPLKKKLIM